MRSLISFMLCLLGGYVGIQFLLAMFEDGVEGKGLLVFGGLFGFGWVVIASIIKAHDETALEEEEEAEKERLEQREVNRDEWLKKAAEKKDD